MKTVRTLGIKIRCGATTCCWLPGKFCPQLRTSRLGTSWHCHLFHDQHGKGIWPSLQDQDGWLQRCPECLAAERK